MSEAIIKTEVYLIRHAESMGNIGHNGNDDISFADREDPILSPKGKRQAELLGERFRDIRLDCILSSGLRRTLSTAFEVVKTQPDDGVKEIEILPILAETGIDEEYEGFSLDELKEDYPVKLAEEIQPGRLVVASKGTDDYWNFERANRVWKYIKNRFSNGEKILVTAHGCFNTSLFLRAINVPPLTGFDVSFTNTGVTKIIFYQQGTGPYGDDINVSYFNDMSHLYKEFPEVIL